MRADFTATQQQSTISDFTIRSRLAETPKKAACQKRQAAARQRRLQREREARVAAELALMGEEIRTLRAGAVRRERGIRDYDRT